MPTEQRTERDPSTREDQAPYMSLISRALAALVGLAIPVAYFALQFQYHQGTLGTETNINAALVAHRLVDDLHAPQLLDTPGAELELLESVDHDIDENEYNERYEARTILNSRGQSVVRSGATSLAWPIIQATAPIAHDGKKLGDFCIQRSLAPLLLTTAWFALLGAAVAWMLFAWLMRGGASARSAPFRIRFEPPRERDFGRF